MRAQPRFWAVFESQISTNKARIMRIVAHPQQNWTIQGTFKLVLQMEYSRWRALKDK
jgi:hypothetical protein